MPKFEVGDKVALNSRTPSHIELARSRPRTVIAIEYDPDGKRYWYTLGSNARGDCKGEPATWGYGSYQFRSYMLDKWNVTDKRGKPRTKRRWHLHRKYTRKSCEYREDRTSVEGNILSHVKTF